MRETGIATTTGIGRNTTKAVIRATSIASTAVTLDLALAKVTIQGKRSTKSTRGGTETLDLNLTLAHHLIGATVHLDASTILHIRSTR